MPSTEIAKSARGIVDETNIAAPTYYWDLTIENGETQSDFFRLASANVIGILFPASMTGTTMTVEISFNGTDWKTLTGVSLTVTSDEALELTSATIFGWPYVRFVSGSAESGDKVLRVVTKEL